MHDYLFATPCFRDIECQYGPDVRTAKSGPEANWRSPEHQGVAKAAALRKAICRRKPIFELLDADSAVPASVICELNELMMKHHTLESADQIVSYHMEWLVRHLSMGRESRGLSFEKRQLISKNAAAARKAARSSAAPEGSRDSAGHS